MMKNVYKTKVAALLTVSAMLAAGCSTSTSGSVKDTSSSSTATTNTSSTDANKANAQLAGLKLDDLVKYDADDTKVNWDAEKSTSITLSGAGANVVKGSGAKVDGSVITISSAGTYVLSGKLSDGSIVIDAGDDDIVHLVLNGAQIQSSTSSAIHVKGAGKTVLTLSEGTENVISDGKTYTGQESAKDGPTAAIYSKDDLTINGTGKLSVQGNFKDGITSKDDLKIVSGTLNITAADDGIVGRDLTAVKEGNITIQAGGDGIKSTNDSGTDKGYLVIGAGAFVIDAGSDGLQAATSMLINGGSYNLRTGGGNAKAEPHKEEQPPQRPDAQGQTKSKENEQATPSTANTSKSTDSAQADSEDSETPSTKGLKAASGISITNGIFNIDSAMIRYTVTAV
ncbi:carbohydrate-binding domain-containing protein [Paenibacillus pini]|uniref:Carbohydrate-binding domain-containing protein n=1 Tax=Paenibacillus pini JCM 16418 TaxID=1236976 RepID=W7YUT3_9BACL|nr:carbohydrate-binding domain-containing protein [Paenibacillus pini]GAF08336.1 hypothetical protein JCM16418_2405 [Paenibacillus pini JCM 16418]